MMHYYQDNKNNWYYNDREGTWYYDHIDVPEETPTEMVEEMLANLQNEEAGLNGDAEMKDVGDEDENDSDYDPDIIEVDQEGMNDLTKVIDGIRDLKTLMTQKFEAQDQQFKDLNLWFDTQETQFQEMRDQFHRWTTCCLT